MYVPDCHFFAPFIRQSQGGRGWWKLLGIWEPRCKFFSTLLIELVFTFQTAFATSKPYWFEVSVCSTSVIILFDQLHQLQDVLGMFKCSRQLFHFLYALHSRSRYTHSRYSGSYCSSSPSSSSISRKSHAVTSEFIALLSFFRFIPIVILALVFNVTNVVGFTYAYVPLPVQLKLIFIHVHSEIETQSNAGPAASLLLVGIWGWAALVDKSWRALWRTALGGCSVDNCFPFDHLVFITGKYLHSLHWKALFEE